MIRRTTTASVGLLIAACSLLVQRSIAQATHTLKPTPKTIAWGYYDASTPPVLRTKSATRVNVHLGLRGETARLLYVSYGARRLTSSWPSLRLICSRLDNFTRRVIID